MPSFINADNGVVSGSSGVKTTADTSGVLALQSNGTTGLTLNTSLAIGVGSGNSTGTNGQVLTSAGSGAAPAWATPAVTSPAGSTGQVQINNAGAFGAVGSGTTGQVLTSQGAGAAPVFATPSSGAMVLLSTVTASSSSTVDIENTFSSTYDAYMLVVNGMKPSNDGSTPVCRLRIGGSYISTSNYRYWFFNPLTDSASVTQSNNNAGSEIYLSSGISNNASAPGAHFIINIHNPTPTGSTKMIYWKGVVGVYGNSSAFQNTDGFAGNATTGALTGIRIYFPAGTVASGTFRLYGLANS